MENVYYTALYKVAKRLDFLLDFCIEKNRKKNLVVWPRLKVSNSYSHMLGWGLIHGVGATSRGGGLFKD